MMHQHTRPSNLQPSNLRSNAYRSLPGDQDIFSLLFSCIFLSTGTLDINFIFVTRSDKKGLIAHNRKSNFFTQIQSYMNALAIRFQCQTWPVITDLLLLAAYSWPAGNPYEQSRVFMVPWEASSELCVLVKSRGAG